LITGLAVILLCVFFAEENWRGRKAWDDCRRDLGARHVEIDPQKFVPAPIPEDENFAATPFLAPLFDLNPRPRTFGAEWRDQAGHDRAVNFAAILFPVKNDGTQPATEFAGRLLDLEGPLAALSGNSKGVASTVTRGGSRSQTAAALLHQLEQYEPVIDELRLASARRSSRFNVEYDAPDPFTILLPHHLVLQRVANVLELRASAELEVGRSDAALSDLKLIVFIAGTFSDEPFLVGWQVCRVILKRAEQLVWEGLASGKWKEAQLKELQDQLRAIPLIKALDNALRADRAHCGGAIFAYFHSHKNALRGWMASDEAAASMAYLLAGPEGWLYQEQAAYHRLYDRYVCGAFEPDTGVFQPHVVIEHRKALEKMFSHFTIWHHTGLSRLALLNTLTVFRRGAMAQAWCDQAVLACALERCRIATGKYPENLDNLVPQFVGAVPLDVCGGGPLKYKVAGPGAFLLYSIGWNETDDGGAVVMNSDGADFDPDQGDWVWPAYPSAAAGAMAR
jgi:hypothetical protein